MNDKENIMNDKENIINEEKYKLILIIKLIQITFVNN